MKSHSYLVTAVVIAFSVLLIIPMWAAYGVMFPKEGGGRIAVRAEQAAGGWTRISVTDTGAGMPPEVVAKAFDPFYTTKDKGLGLGLPIVQKIVEEEFSGTLQIESPPGGGATVRIVVPRA